MIIWPKVSKRVICQDEPECSRKCLDANILRFQWILFISFLVAVGLYIIYQIVMLFWGFYRKIKQKRIAARRWAW